MMRKTLSFLVTAVLLALAAVAPASPGTGAAALAASQGTDLWGGPGAKGAGNQGAQFDTTVYVTGPAPAAGAVDFWTGGTVVATAPFTVPANGVAAIAAPAGLSGLGAFIYHVHSDAPVAAWSETYNETPDGRYGVSLAAVSPSELLAPGDESTGGGVEASSSTDPGRARTNVGVVCVSTATQACRVEVAAFEAGAFVGSGLVEAIPGGAAQSSLEGLVPATAGKAGLALRLRLLSGAGLPYVIRNDNRTSDGTAIPLSVRRGAFSTAPTIVSFTASPGSGCAPLETTFSWATTGAAKVSISGVGNDLPPNGSVKATVQASDDYVLTATSLTGQTAVKPVRVTITPSTPAPTPSPATATVPAGGVVSGIFPAGTGPLTTTFVQRESTGSTFTVQGNAWVYTAGTSPGTDIVKITATGSCGETSSEFRANVLLPGAPWIVRFEAIPERTCAPSANILLTWQTENVYGVHIDGYDELFLPNGGLDTTITGAASFTLTALGDDGTTASATVSVPMDPQLYVPTLTPGSANVASGTYVTIDVNPGSVPSFDGVRYVIVQMPSGGSIRPDPNGVPGRYLYRAGLRQGVDVIRFLWVNGCGIGYSDFTANVTAKAP